MSRFKFAESLAPPAKETVKKEKPAKPEKRAGRPKLDTPNEREPWTVKVLPSLRAGLKSMAAEKGTTVEAVLETVLASAINKWKSKGKKNNDDEET